MAAYNFLRSVPLDAFGCRVPGLYISVWIELKNRIVADAFNKELKQLMVGRTTFGIVTVRSFCGFDGHRGIIAHGNRRRKVCEAYLKTKGSPNWISPQARPWAEG